MNLIQRNPWLLDLCSIVAGAILPLAFAPFNYYWAAFISPALALALWSNIKPQRAALRGWLYGLGFFGVGISWVYVSIRVYGEAPILLAALFTFLLAGTLGLFTALQAWIWQRVFDFKNSLHVLLAFPALWTISEWLREWVLSGFPWLFLGQAQTEQFLSGYLPVIGVYGVSFICVLASMLLFLAMFRSKQFFKCSAAFILILIIGGLLRHVTWTTPSNKPINVMLVQGNVAQDTKWDPTHAFRSIDTYAELTFKAKPENTLVVWAENAFTIPLPDVAPVLAEISHELHRNNNSLITGIPYVQDQQHIYNAVVSSENPEQLYLKRHLVPFGEYLPLENMLRGLISFFNLPMSSFSKGTLEQPLLNAKGLAIAPYICYEVAFPYLFAHDVPNGDILLTVSNDTWFGNSLGPIQHLQIAQTRAVEMQRMMIRATNNGISAIINANGSIAARAPQFVPTTLTAAVQAYTGMTPVQRFGYLPSVLFAFGCVIVLSLRRCLLSVRASGGATNSSIAT